MTETASIFKGDTGGPWNVGHRLDDGTLATLGVTYTCSIKVAGTAIERAVTDKTGDDKRFIAALTPTETNTLTPGQYVVAIEVINNSLTPPLRVETHIILTVSEQIVGSDHVPPAATELDRLNALKTALEDALLIAAGGAPVEVWNGRYGNKVKYQTMSYDQIEAALARVKRDIAAEERVAAGGSRRAPIGVFWN
jgi:hypothetical protein